jgi:hypothetical protein
MARGRMVNTSIARDPRLAALSVEAEYLYLKALPHLDRDGLIWAEPETLWGTVCPRRPEMLQRIDDLVAEWIGQHLVVAYQTPEGRALWFPSFAKNQVGLRYEREPASLIQAPPGCRRTAAGLVPEDFRQSSGNLPADSRPEVEVEVEVEALTPARERAHARPPRGNSRSAGEVAAAQLQGLNAQVPALDRRILADALLDAESLQALANIGDDNGDRVLHQAHEDAVTLFRMGITTPDQVQRVVADWRKNSWQAKGGSPPSGRQLIAHASQYLASQATRSPEPMPAIPEAFPGGG